MARSRRYSFHPEHGGFTYPTPEREVYGVQEAASRWKLPPDMIGAWCRGERVPGATFNEDEARWEIPGEVVEGKRPLPNTMEFSEGLDYLNHLPVDVEGAKPA